MLRVHQDHLAGPAELASQALPLTGCSLLGQGLVLLSRPLVQSGVDSPPQHPLSSPLRRGSYNFHVRLQGDMGMNIVGIRIVWGQEKILMKNAHLSRGCYGPLPSLGSGRERKMFSGRGRPKGAAQFWASVSCPSLARNQVNVPRSLGEGQGTGDGLSSLMSCILWRRGWGTVGKSASLSITLCDIYNLILALSPTPVPRRNGRHRICCSWR